MSTIGKKLIFASLVKVRLRFRQVVVMLRATVNLQGLNVNLCKHPNNLCVCVYVFPWDPVRTD